MINSPLYQVQMRHDDNTTNWVIWKTRTTWTRTTRTRTRKKYDKKQSKRKMRKKSYHPFYKVTILCEIIVRVRVRVTVRVRLSMLSVSVFSRYVVRVFQITNKLCLLHGEFAWWCQMCSYV